MLYFAKYEGLGNDFILIDDRERIFDVKRLYMLCHRKFGIGADGVLLLQKSAVADVRMRIFNADGSEAKACGNGVRCMYKYLLELGFPPKSYRIEVGGKSIEAHLVQGQVAVCMGKVGLSKPIVLEGKEGHLVDSGVPHAIFFVTDIHSFDLTRFAKNNRFHPLFGQEGANINVVEQDGKHSFQMRTFERGVEEETLACGTGAVAVASMAKEKKISIHFPGGTLQVERRGDLFWMIGPANKVFSGILA